MIGNVLVILYRIRKNFIRNRVVKLIKKIEGGEFKSKSLRKIFSKYYKVEIGLYTHGGAFRPGQIDKHTSIGRYCSIAVSAHTMNRNHPMDFKSMHAYFFNPGLSLCKEDKIEYTPLEIGNDVWIGHNAIIMPHVQKIADGAVVAAGAVVNKDVPPYAVVVGNPARVVRYRFSQEVIDRLLEEKWWEKDIDELKDKPEYFQPYEVAEDIV